MAKKNVFILFLINNIYDINILLLDTNNHMYIYNLFVRDYSFEGFTFIISFYFTIQGYGQVL